MGLLIKYGSYEFNQDTTTVPISRSYERDGQGRLDRISETWTITTQLQATTQPAISTLIEALEDALEDNDETLRIKQNDGSTNTPHTVSNCVVDSLSYPNSTGAEYANRRTAVVTITGYTDVTKDDNIISFNETYSLSGGGARRTVMEILSGDPKAFILCNKTAVYATQRGTAIGKEEYPTPPAAMYPTLMVNSEGDIEKSTSRTENGDLRYSISWTYNFVATTRSSLDSNPGTWI